MDLTDLLTAVRYRWRWLGSGLLVGIVAAVLVASLTPREYTSTATLYINPSKAGQSSTSTDVSSTYAALASSDVVARLAIDELDLDVSPREFLSHVTTSISPNTYLLDVSVADSSSQGARAAANAMSRILVIYISAVATSTSVDPSTLDLSTIPTDAPVSIVQPASDPGAPAAPPFALALAVGVLLGLILGVVFAVAAEARRRRVRSVESLAAVDPRVVVLGSVDLVPDPLAANDDPRLTDTFRALAAALTAPATRFRSATVTSIGPDMSTVVCARLSQVLVDAGHLVTMVDADTRDASLTTALGHQDRPGLVDLLDGSPHPVTEVVAPGLHIIASGALTPDGGAVAAAPALPDVIGDVVRQQQLVVVSAAPLSDHVDAALVGRATDLTMVTVVLHQTSWKQIRAALDVLSASGTKRPVFVIARARRRVPRGRGRRRET